jgi:hypothetical protein
MRDSEQSFGSYTLDVYEGDGEWICDWWERSKPDNCGQVKAKRRKVVISRAKAFIDERENTAINQKGNAK